MHTNLFSEGALRGAILLPCGALTGCPFCVELIVLFIFHYAFYNSTGEHFPDSKYAAYLPFQPADPICQTLHYATLSSTSFFHIMILIKTELHTGGCCNVHRSAATMIVFT